MQNCLGSQNAMRKKLPILFFKTGKKRIYISTQVVFLLFATMRSSPSFYFVLRFNLPHIHA